MQNMSELLLLLSLLCIIVRVGKAWVGLKAI